MCSSDLSVAGAVLSADEASMVKQVKKCNVCSFASFKSQDHSRGPKINVTKPNPLSCFIAVFTHECNLIETVDVSQPK